MSTIKRGTRRHLMRRIAIGGAVATTAIILAACGNNSDMAGMDHGSESSVSAAPEAGDTPAPETFNDADVMFAQMMIPHHEQAVAMAQLTDGRARDSEIKTLSEEIKNAQDPEIKTMKSWLKAWGKPASPSGTPGMDHGTQDGAGMSGMMSDKDMQDLEAATGTDFDRKFARLMIAHHNGAIEMAKDEQKNGRNSTAKKLAGDVVKSQSSEVTRLNKILDRL